MTTLVTVLQIVIALGIFNVWLLRIGKTTNYRGGSAKTMKEEFQVYGLPDGALPIIGGLKLLLAVCLILGIWFTALTRPAAGGMAVLMLGAVFMHFKVKDPPVKFLPAFTMLVLSLLVAFL